MLDLTYVKPGTLLPSVMHALIGFAFKSHHGFEFGRRIHEA